MKDKELAKADRVQGKQRRASLGIEPSLYVAEKWGYQLSTIVRL